MLRPIEVHGSIRWLSRDLAIGCPEDGAGWGAARARGVHAVVDVTHQCGAVAEQVRQHGMRYLRMSVEHSGLPPAEELHIVTSWVLERIHEGGGVLLHDSEGHGNDLLLACALYVKMGSGLEKARSRLRVTAHASLTAPQVDLLRRFVAQRARADYRAALAQSR